MERVGTPETSGRARIARVGVAEGAGGKKPDAERLKAGIDVERPISLGVLKIKAKLGEMMPSQQGKRGLPKPALGSDYTAPTISTYRKIGGRDGGKKEWKSFCLQTGQKVKRKSFVPNWVKTLKAWTSEGQKWRNP